ncbi:hypothetical protein BGZ92_010921 [Podila epicladia]|nr:hypothetical protein BGZ92_010921 [Podila epicladia]
MPSRRSGNGQDSNMQSEHHMETSRSSPLRAAALRPEGTEVKVAGNDYGGVRQKIPSSESISVDNKGSTLPLDKAVVEEITASRKEKEAVNQTAKDSGPSGKKSSGDGLPKEFVYREEDFMPLSYTNPSQRGPSMSNKSTPSGAKAPSQAIKAESAHKSPGSAPHHGLSSTLLKPHSHKSNAVDSPELFPEESSQTTAKKSSLPHLQHQQADSSELSLGTLSPEESARKTSTTKPTFNTSRPEFKAPAHIANMPKIKHAPHQATPHHHEEAHTPEMSLGSLFQESEEPSTRHYQQSTQALPKSLRVHAFETPSQSHGTKASGGQQQLYAKSKAPVQSLDDGPAPKLHSLSQQFFAKSSSHSHEPSAHHSTAAPIHYSAMPPVHHAPPAHHSAPEHHFPAEHISPLIHAGAAVPHASAHTSNVESTDPMHRAHAAPIYHASSIAQPLPPVHRDGPSHHAPTQIESIHMPHHASEHSPAHGSTEHRTHIETIHAAYHPEEAHKKKTSYGVKAPAKDVQKAASLPYGNTHPRALAATPTSAPALAHEVSKDYPVVALGKSHDEPLKSKYNDLTPVKSQADGAGLNAASFPSFARPDTSTQVQAHHTAEHAQHMPTHTYKPNKRSKRSRKAAKKQEVARSLGVLGSISEALVGRRKNTVSTPDMRLNEIFGEAEGPITHDAPIHAQGTTHGVNIVAPAAAVAAGLGGIRNLLGAIHMPAIISRHPPDNTHQYDPKMTSDSAHSTHVVGHMQHRHTPSKAVALKTPKINLSLFPEEDASYPRGDVSKHENPAHPKNIVDVTEIHYQLPSHVPSHIPTHSAHVPATVIQAPAVHAHAVPAPLHRAPLGHVHLDLHTHQGPNRPAVSAQSAHGAGVVHNIHPQHKHSYAAALKKPKVKLNAFPEEQADYPRGDDKHHENWPSRPLHTPIEVHEALGNMHSDLHTHQAPNQPAVSAQSAHGAGVVPNTHPQHKHSNAAELKKPKAKLNVFPEEQADYPRGDDKHHENKPSRPLHTPIEVHEVVPAAMSRKARRQRKNSKAAALKKATVPVGAFPEEETTYPRDDGKHYENTPSRPMHTPVESAAAVVSHGLENIKAMLGGIHMPAMPNPEAQATLASLGAATTLHAAAPHNEEHKIHRQGANLPLMYGTPVHAATAHTPIKPVHVEHHDPHLTHTAAAAPLAHVSHRAPAVVPVYIAEPVVQVHSQDPVELTHTPAHAPAPGKTSSTSAQHSIALGEHRRRGMDIHGTADDDENYFSADDIKSPDTTSTFKVKSGTDHSILHHNAPVSVIPPWNDSIKASSVHIVAPENYFSADDMKSPDTTSASKLKSGADPSILHHNAPVSVIPPWGDSIKTSSTLVAPAHDQHAPAPVAAPIASPQHYSRGAVPVMASAAVIPIAGAIHHAEKHAHEARVPTVHQAERPIAHKTAPVSVSAARIPIAKPPVEMVSHCTTWKTPSTTNVPVVPNAPVAQLPTRTHAAPAIQHTPSAPVVRAPDQAPAASGHVDHAAISLMGATAASVKPDEVIVMESAMPKYKEAPKPDHSHYIPVSAVAPVIPIKAASAQAPHTQASVPAPAVAAKSTTTTAAIPIAAPLTAKPKAEVSDVKHTSDMAHNLSHAAAPVAATIATAAIGHNAHNKFDAPVQTARTVEPELKLHDRDVIKPTTTTYDDPNIKPVEVKVAKPVVETAKPVAVAQSVKHEAPVLGKTAHTSTTKPTPIALPVASQETPVVTRSTHTAPIAVSVPVGKHEKTTVTTNTKPAPVPAVRPVVAAAVAAPAAAAAAPAHHYHTAAPVEPQTTRTTVTTTETPRVSSAQQIQQQYQQSHQTTASSTSNSHHVDLPIQAASSSSTQPATTRQAEMPIQMQHATTGSSSSNTVIPPPGYSGAIPTVNEGETVMWVKKVYTTHDYYDSEDEDGIDELGYRKDRDVSRYIPGGHFRQSNINNADHVGVNAQHQPQMHANTQIQPQTASNAQYQYPRQPGLAPLQAQTTNAQALSQSQSEMTHAQFQQHTQANNAYAQTLSPSQGQTLSRSQSQTLSPTQAQHQEQARRPSQPQVHPNNPQTRRASQATFKQHLKDYRRRSSVTAANSSQNANAGKNASIDNKQQRQAAQ